MISVSSQQVLGPYGVSKTALLGLTKVLSKELSPDGIRVNSIAPGIIKTKFSQAVSALSTIESSIECVGFRSIFMLYCRDRLEVRTLRCGRNNPGSNPGHGIF